MNVLTNVSTATTAASNVLTNVSTASNTASTVAASLQQQFLTVSNHGK
jgi:hypothetical protein